MHQRKSLREFAELALGIADPDGNYSAAEHGLGPKILAENLNAEHRVSGLAGEFMSLTEAHRVPELIRRRQPKYLQIGVGSEVSCLVNPRVCWVANTRTIWTHSVIKHDDNTHRADEELKLYRAADTSSEMAYQMWSQIHSGLDVALTRVAERGQKLARTAKVVSGEITYLWADAIASHLYAMHHP